MELINFYYNAEALYVYVLGAKIKIVIKVFEVRLG